MLNLLKNRLILDCSTLLPGPSVGKLLREKGARVIKIESQKYPDKARVMGLFYNDLNENKEILTLDLTEASDRKQFNQLVISAHGLIEGFRPQTKIKLGLDEKSLHALNPSLCIASLVGYPEDGPWRDRAGHNLNFEAITGCASLFTEMPALPLGDLFSAYEAAFSLACAMDAVSRGQSLGIRISVSISEVLFQIQSGFFRTYGKTGVPPRPGETLFSGLYPCYRLYESSEGRRISVGAIEAKFWQKFVSLIGKPEFESEGYADGARGQEIIAEVQAVLGSKSWTEWKKVFANADCCVEPVLDYSEIDRHGLQS